MRNRNDGRTVPFLRNREDNRLYDPRRPTSSLDKIPQKRGANKVTGLCRTRSTMGTTDGLPLGPGEGWHEKTLKARSRCKRVTARRSTLKARSRCKRVTARQRRSRSVETNEETCGLRHVVLCGGFPPHRRPFYLPAGTATRPGY